MYISCFLLRKESVNRAASLPSLMDCETVAMSEENHVWLYVVVTTVLFWNGMSDVLTNREPEIVFLGKWFYNAGLFYCT